MAFGYVAASGTLAAHWRTPTALSPCSVQRSDCGSDIGGLTKPLVAVKTVIAKMDYALLCLDGKLFGRW